jgi:hypothetical protein
MHLRAMAIKRPEDMTIRYDYSEGVDERKKIRETLGGGSVGKRGKGDVSVGGKRKGRAPGF